MTANTFRTLALSLPETAESAHMGHPDFRVGGKIFATLWCDNRKGMVKLTPDQQSAFVQAEPDVFEAVPGAWGASGCTNVNLVAATKRTLRPAMVAAWHNTAPRRVSQEHDEL